MSLRVAIVGCGKIADAHAAQIRRIPGCDLVGVCDREELMARQLAERANGRIPRPADFSWPWGDALRILDDLAPDVRVINLETSITRSSAFTPGKAVHYRMSPGNVPCVAAARPDACALANNHVLDFGRRGLRDTLDPRMKKRL